MKLIYIWNASGLALGPHFSQCLIMLSLSRIRVLNLLIYVFLTIISIAAIAMKYSGKVYPQDMGQSFFYFGQFIFDSFIVFLILRKHLLAKYLIIFHMIVSPLFWILSSSIFFFATMFSTASFIFQYFIEHIPIVIYPFIFFWSLLCFYNIYATINKPWIKEE